MTLCFVALVGLFWVVGFAYGILVCYAWFRCFLDGYFACLVLIWLLVVGCFTGSDFDVLM